MSENKTPRPPIESGCPDGFQFMHPMMRKQYGNWAYHEDPQPGVLKHVTNDGDAIYTVRCATQRILDVETLDTPGVYHTLNQLKPKTPAFGTV